MLVSRLFPTLLLSVSSVISAPLSPRQSISPSRFADGATAIKDLFHALAQDIGTATANETGTTRTDKYYSVCNEASGGNVTRVQVEPCEGGNGTQGNACVFTAGKNYTIIITYTSPLDVDTPRAGLASYNGDQKSAYPGQSFDACRYTPCPVRSGVESNYTYPFRTFQAPSFDRLVFNAAAGVQGPSFICVVIPIALCVPLLWMCIKRRQFKKGLTVPVHQTS